MLPQLTISPIVEDFISRFDVKEDHHALFQMKVARWQLDHKKYAQAMLTIHEAMVTYVCEQNKLEWDGYDSRELAKAALKYRPEAKALKCDRELRKIYKQLQPLRNCTAHSLETEKNVTEMLRALTESVAKLETIIK